MRIEPISSTISPPTSHPVFHIVSVNKDFFKYFFLIVRMLKSKKKLSTYFTSKQKIFHLELNYKLLVLKSLTFLTVFRCNFYYSSDVNWHVLFNCCLYFSFLVIMNTVVSSYLNKTLKEHVFTLTTNVRFDSFLAASISLEAWKLTPLTGRNNWTL